MNVQDFGAFAIQPLTETGNIAQRAEAFFADGPGKMFSTTRPYLLAQFGGDQFRSAQVERYQRLNDVHGFSPCLIHQSILGAAVGTAGRTGLLNGQVDPGMRIPQLLLGCWAGQGQVGSLDLVFTFCTCGFQAGIRGVSGVCHNAVSLLSSICINAYFTAPAMNSVSKLQTNGLNAGFSGRAA